MKEMKKKFHWKIFQSLSFGFETFWIEILVPCRFVGGSGLIAFTFDLLARDFVVGTSICVKQVRLLPFFLFLIRDSFRVSHTQDEVV